MARAERTVYRLLKSNFFKRRAKRLLFSDRLRNFLGDTMRSQLEILSARQSQSFPISWILSKL
jgi:hypothetical protein